MRGCGWQQDLVHLDELDAYCKCSQTWEARLAVCKVPFDIHCEWDQWLAVMFWKILQDVCHLLIIPFCLEFKHTPIYWYCLSASLVDSHQPAPSARIQQIHNFIDHVICKRVQHTYRNVSMIHLLQLHPATSRVVEKEEFDDWESMSATLYYWQADFKYDTQLKRDKRCTRR